MGVVSIPSETETIIRGMEGPHFERYQADDGWRYRLRGANGEIVLPPEAVSRREDVERQVNDMLAVAVDASMPVAVAGGEPTLIAKIEDAE